MFIANHLLEFTDLEEIWLVVSPHNPLKNKSTLALDYDRLRMVELAIEDYPCFRLCDIEFHLPQPGYTVDTLLKLTEAYPNREFCLIIGSDNLDTFEKWKNYEFLLRHFPIYVYPRPGFDPQTAERFSSYAKQLQIVENAPLMEISASYIRQGIRLKKNVRPLLEEKVFHYIEKNGLYL